MDRVHYHMQKLLHDLHECYSLRFVQCYIYAGCMSLTAIAADTRVSPFSLSQFPWLMGVWDTWVYLCFQQGIVAVFCSASRVNVHLALAKVPACDIGLSS